MDIKTLFEEIAHCLAYIEVYENGRLERTNSVLTIDSSNAILWDGGIIEYPDLEKADISQLAKGVYAIDMETKTVTLSVE